MTEGCSPPVPRQDDGEVKGRTNIIVTERTLASTKASKTVEKRRGGPEES